MKDFLLVLFYQAIVAVNVAVILSAIVWLAKRKEEQEKKPNPDFTPPPEKKPPKPPTTGTNVIEPKPNGYHLTMTTYDAKDYGKTHTFNGEEYERTMVGQSADGSVISMNYRRKHPQPKPSGMPKPPTTGSAAIKPKYGISADEAAKLVSKLAEASACLGGNSELDELRERFKDFADRLDRVEKKPVTPERLKEAGFEVEPVNVFNPAEESAKRYGAYFLDAKCQNCKHYLATDEDAMTGLCGMKDEIAFGNSFHACFEKREKE